jgi:hypothetical protein
MKILSTVDCNISGLKKVTSEAQFFFVPEVLGRVVAPGSSVLASQD